jgi:phage terminase large subunit-like protein
MAAMSPAEKARLSYDWRFWARDNQIAPAGDWFVWLLLAGRGFGKTRTAVEWVRGLVDTANEPIRIALVAETAADARDVIVEGESGILACSPPWNRPLYEPSKRRITWPNGSTATTYSADDPEQLRGPQHHYAWCDELAKYRYADDLWSNLIFGLRLGARPQVCVTTTPRPIKVIRDLLKDTATVITRGGTLENAPNLAQSAVDQMIRRYGGTRIGRQELDGEVLDDVPGALWTRAMLDDARTRELPTMRRVVVAVDPSGGDGSDDKADEIGIVVAGRGDDGLAYVLADMTCSLSPAGWGRRTVEAYTAFKADRVVAERNFGGAMVEAVIRTAGPNTPVKLVTASRGKIARAEPVAALYEQNRVKHHGAFPQLEDQLCGFTPNGYVGDGSPDRADALVWALTELMIENQSGLLEFAQAEIDRMKREAEQDG